MEHWDGSANKEQMRERTMRKSWTLNSKATTLAWNTLGLPAMIF